LKVTEEEPRNSYVQSQNVNLHQGDSSSNKIDKTETSDEDNPLSNTTKEEKEEKNDSINGRKIRYC